MHKCVRKIHFCSGHRVFKHESKCSKLHGHNYVAWVYAYSKHLDEIGRVVDFSVLKDVIGGWIDKNWDHKFLIWEKDDDAGLLCEHFKESIVLLDFNPTAENMAEYLLKISNELLKKYPVEIYNIELYETENCKAIANAR